MLQVHGEYGVPLAETFYLKMENQCMPITVASMKTTCQSCGWSKIIPQQGDVLFVIKQCESCGSELLIQTPSGGLDKLNPVSFIRDMLSK